MKINIYYILFHKFNIYNIKKKKEKKNIFLNPLEYTITFNVILHLLLDYNAQAL